MTWVEGMIDNLSNLGVEPEPELYFSHHNL